MPHTDPKLPPDEDSTPRTFKRETTADDLAAAGIILDKAQTTRLKTLHGDVLKARKREIDASEEHKAAKGALKDAEQLLDIFLSRLTAPALEKDPSMPLFSDHSKKKSGPDRWHTRRRAGGKKKG